eukprot:GGOE01020981.1.p2 GENE.GGOE01020981.1~~GGOE01020981.1.p2  ORF type:complete len:280 (+),score=85.95 GGOE01020981.1:102-842(+)
MASENEHKKWNAQEYLGQHSVHSLFQQLTAELILYKPNSPLEYMYDRVAEMKEGRPGVRPKIIFLLGPPGSGRGTQGTKVMEHFGYKHLVAGDLLRREALSGSEQGRALLATIRDGGLAPSCVIIPLLAQAIEAEPLGTHYVIDGFPRELAQAVTFESQFCECRFAIFLECPDAVCKKRLADRAAQLNTPVDGPEMVEKRLQTFRRDGLPVAEYLEALGKLRRVDAQGTVEEVWRRIELLFEPLPL